MNESIDWLISRRSIRRYLPDPIPPEIIKKLLTAGSWAPSAHNRQPWRFAVITNLEIKIRLAIEMGRKLREDLTADLVPQQIIDKDVKRSFQRITNAPLISLLCLTMLDMDQYPDEERQHKEWVMAVQSTAMAGQNLLLAAHSLGLGACWMCAPLFCPDVVKTSLNLPDHWQPQALITIGYPAEMRLKTRIPLHNLVKFVER